MRLDGRAEDVAALRDAWHLRPAGADPGPAGAIFWRLTPAGLAAASATSTFEKNIDQLGFHSDVEALWDLCTEMEEVAASHRPAPFVAAIVAQVVAIRPDAELFASWPADLVLAQGCAGCGRCRSRWRKLLVRPSAQKPAGHRSDLGAKL